MTYFANHNPQLCCGTCLASSGHAMFTNVNDGKHSTDGLYFYWTYRKGEIYGK